MLENIRLEQVFSSSYKLHNINITLFKQEIHGIVVKSHTCREGLFRLLTGEMRPNFGSLYINGESDFFLSRYDAKKKGVDAISRKSQMIPEMRIYENIFINVKGNYFKRLLPRRFYEEEASKLLEEVGLNYISPSAKAWRLSEAEGHLVEVIKASMLQTKVLIIDDITQKYSEEEMGNLKKLLIQKRDQGMTIVFLTNRYMDLFEIADRMTFIRKGTTVAHVTDTPISYESTLVYLDETSLRATSRRVPEAIGKDLFAVKDFAPEELPPLNMSLKKGEIVGVVESNWERNLSYGKAFFGMLPYSGRVELDGQLLEVHSSKNAIKNGIGYISMAENKSLIFQNMGLIDNIALMLGERYDTPLRLTNPRVREFKVRQVLEELDCLDLLEKYPSHLPVQEMRKVDQLRVALAKWFCIKPKVLILLNPHIGFDETSTIEFQNLLRVFTEKGTGVLIFSTNHGTLADICDRLVILNK